LEKVRLRASQNGSSPVVGHTPDGQGDIIYFGDGNGKIYALNADGTRR